MTWRPLSVRTGETDATVWEGPYEDIQPWMVSSVSSWLMTFFRDTSPYNPNRWNVFELQRIERELRLPLPWADFESAMNGLLEYALAGRGIDVLDWCVFNTSKPGQAMLLELMLAEAGSAWTVGTDENGKNQLQRRVDSTATLAAKSAAPAGRRSGLHLASAWSRAYGKSPDPTGAYREAVRAVEAAAAPVILPRDPKATLGTMIPAIEAKPSKWKVVLQPSGGRDGVTEVVSMMRLLWTAQADRHGTADPAAPLSVSIEEARAAVHLAAALVQLFESGAIAIR
jgi:hypothetical protein